MIEQQRQKFGKAKISTHNGQSLLNKATGFIAAYDFTLNPYRGCEYGCSYCYAAAFSPNSQMGQDWGNWVIIKQNAVELLEQELKRWQKQHPDTPPSIYMSSVTDPYQPIEAKEKLTRQLLEVMIDYQPTLVIQTRSPMIVRDVDLLRQLERLRVNLSIPTGSDHVRKDFEGRSPSIKARLQAIARLKYSIPCNESHDARFSITLTPLLPTFPEEEANFISKLAVVDRLVIQAFHSQNPKSLVASTRQEAMAIKKKYSWWYDQEEENYKQFKSKLTAMLPQLEIMEGKQGFGYD